MFCRDAMLTLVFHCREDDTAQKCAQLMAEEKIGFMPVLGEDGRVAGVITDRDLAIRLVAKGLPTSTPLRELMTVGELVTCAPTDDLRLLESKMAAAKKSRALVMENDRVVGVISLSDLAVTEMSSRRTGWLLREVMRRESGHIVVS